LRHFCINNYTLLHCVFPGSRGCWL